MVRRSTAGSWREEHEKTLIWFYSEHPILWNPRHPEYYKRDQRDELLAQLRKKLQEENHLIVTANEIKKKFKYLRNSFMREEHKVNKSKSSGVNGGGTHIPKWVYYKDLLFLRDAPMKHESHTTRAHVQENSRGADELQVLEMFVSVSDSESTAITGDVPGPCAPSSTSYRAQPAFRDVGMVCSTLVGNDATRSSTKRPHKRAREMSEQARCAFFERATKVIEVPEAPADGCKLFADHVAESLRKLNVDLQEEAKLDIQRMLFRYQQRLRESHD